ncbi:phosphatase PAP2 family protein [Altererythrobacter arenosus]|uniref:Phosphatase PAP2 family protein n=1 Tax=Altererythrobacter arenosus TaxID=3032592 RepID=A0ABY8FNC7_9SPHN|nr:phosphatase PAP2 family protein [Altererythrobacter sp. CAU 1644]WFL76511.1 phosphatase PAP2 family protein [Altererythrobacter sp. CAU 1644]
MKRNSPQVDEHAIADWPIVIVVLSFCALSYFFLLQHGIVRDVVRSASTNFTLYFAMWIFMVLGSVLFRLAIDRPNFPISHIRLSVLNATLFKRTFEFLGLLGCLTLFMPLFSAFKSAIPLFNPYSWDPTFIAWDRVIFMGSDAWQAIHPFFGFPVVTSALSLGYHLWILLIFAGSIFMGIYQQNPVLRQRYFIAYFLSWSIIGIGFANALSSVGPVFAGPLLGLDTFDAQTAYLREADKQWPVMVLSVQESLLAWHRSGDHGLGRGITAMPSMHVALAFLFYLAMREVSKLWSRLSLAFLIIIFIGSIHLAYHYAVDGLVAIILVLPIWYLSGTFARAPQKRGLSWLGVPFWDLIRERGQTRASV